ncbi:hypothetical protein B0G81_8543 [Paraburkholderia sp. BL6665CI2N2]|nr:hypothetical protein B0G81_8543 [Paraburkholderia sp. BL6665CI2N2]
MLCTRWYVTYSLRSSVLLLLTVSCQMTVYTKIFTPSSLVS